VTWSQVQAVLLFMMGFVVTASAAGITSTLGVPWGMALILGSAMGLVSVYRTWYIMIETGKGETWT